MFSFCSVEQTVEQRRYDAHVIQWIGEMENKLHTKKDNRSFPPTPIETQQSDSSVCKPTEGTNSAYVNSEI